MNFEGLGRPDALLVVRAGLSEEFAALIDPTVIERVAAEEVAAFEAARVRDFIPILALRRGRARLMEWAHVTYQSGHTDDPGRGHATYRSAEL